MLFFCGLFHFNHGVYFGKPYDSEAILNLAIVCDKYDCSQSISPMVPYLLTETTSYNALSIESCRELAEASYLINDASHFEEYT